MVDFDINTLSQNLRTIWLALKQLPQKYVLSNTSNEILDTNEPNLHNNLIEPIRIENKQIIFNAQFFSCEIRQFSQFENQDYLIWEIDTDEIAHLKNALAYAENEKSQILDSMLDGAVLVSTDFKIKYANKKFKELHPEFKHNMQDQPCYKVIHNMDNPCLNCSVERVLKTRDFHRTIRSVKNGPSILTLTYPVFDEKNEINGAVITYRDISESKNTEKALKKEATINKVIAEISQEILLPELSEDSIAKRILSAALSITKSSTGFVSSLDHESQKLKWQAFENYSLKRDSIENEPCLKQENYSCINTLLQAKKIPFISNHLKNYLKENEINECGMTRENCLMVPAMFNNELIGQLYVSGSDRPFIENDIEVLKQLANIYALSIYRLNSERELVKAKVQAEDNNKLKSAFLANMSHEIRTPMNSINGFTELLRNTQQPPEKQRQLLDVIYKSSNQLLDIINNILDVSKLEVGQLKIIRHDYDVNQLILDTLQTLPPSFFSESEVEIKTRMPIKGNESIIHCDNSRIQQVLTNLLNNAIKFTSEGFIEIGYEFHDKTVEFYVKDTGIGIPKEKHQLVFERFGQAEEGYARNFEGAGLGLPICKGFVELMGGKIWLESDLNQGAAFHFTIPYDKAKLPPILNNEPLPNISYDWHNKKILLVEDESFSQSFLETLILPFGATLIYAGDGFEALNQVRLNPDIDLILMDIRLPRLDGIEATKKIRLLGFNKPIIAQTANALIDDQKLCFEAGCSDFIAKPIDRLPFLKKINDRLNS